MNKDFQHSSTIDRNISHIDPTKGRAIQFFSHKDIYDSPCKCSELFCLRGSYSLSEAKKKELILRENTRYQVRTSRRRSSR